MDFSLSPQEEAFRKELCDWLDVNAAELRKRRASLGPGMLGLGGLPPIVPPCHRGSPAPRGEPDPVQEFTRWWHKKLYDAGYVGIAWPKEYGGRGATLMEQVIFNEEMAKRRLPTGVGGLGVGWAGTDYHRPRERGAEEAFSAPRYSAVKRSGARPFRSLGPVLTSLAVRPGPLRTVIIMSSTGRRSGQPGVWGRTGQFSWRKQTLTPRRPDTGHSATSSWTCILPALPFARCGR